MTQSHMWGENYSLPQESPPFSHNKCGLTPPMRGGRTTLVGVNNFAMTLYKVNLNSMDVRRARNN